MELQWTRNRRISFQNHSTHHTRCNSPPFPGKLPRKAHHPGCWAAPQPSGCYPSPDRLPSTSIARSCDSSNPATHPSPLRYHSLVSAGAQSACCSQSRWTGWPVQCGECSSTSEPLSNSSPDWGTQTVCWQWCFLEGKEHTKHCDETHIDTKGGMFQFTRYEYTFLLVTRHGPGWFYKILSFFFFNGKEIKIKRL